jgi:hypothetical protein
MLQHLTNSFFNSYSSRNLYDLLTHCHCFTQAFIQNSSILALFPPSSFSFLTCGNSLGLILRITYVTAHSLIQKYIKEPDSFFAFTYTFVTSKALFFISVSPTHLGRLCTSYNNFILYVIARWVFLKIQFLSFCFPSQKSSMLSDCLQE